MQSGKRSRRRSGDEATVAYVSCSGHYYPLQHPAGLSVLLLPAWYCDHCIQSWPASRPVDSQCAQVLKVNCLFHIHKWNWTYSGKPLTLLAKTRTIVCSQITNLTHASASSSESGHIIKIIAQWWNVLCTNSYQPVFNVMWLLSRTTLSWRRSSVHV